MISLIVNELDKVFHKKSIYVLGFVQLLFVLLNLYICKISDITNSSEVLLSEFGFVNLFVIVGIVMISGSIVSDEYSKGTIKYLLIKPYERYKILLSKLICAFVVFVINFIFYFLLCNLIYGFLDMFYSYSFSMYKNVFESILYLMPEYMIMLCFSFFVSCLVNNSGSSIALGLSLFIGSSVINDIVINYNLECFKWIPTLCWDLNNRGDNSIYFCLLVCVVTIILLLISSFIIFNNKEIKNT